MSKPAGLTVFPPHEDPAGDCVLARLLAEEPHRLGLEFPPGFAGGIAHRLDRSTSGALVVADDPGELARIRRAFSDKTLRKVYRLRAARSVPWTSHHCEAEIGHDRRRKKRMVVRRGAATPHRGKWLAARTDFRHLFRDVFEAEMHSGVMHQIRVHAAFLGIPLLGDRLYGGGETPDGAPGGLTFFLHHVGLSGAGIQTEPIPLPAWASAPEG